MVSSLMVLDCSYSGHVSDSCTQCMLIVHTYVYVYMSPSICCYRMLLKRFLRSEDVVYLMNCWNPSLKSFGDGWMLILEFSTEVVAMIWIYDTLSLWKYLGLRFCSIPSATRVIPVFSLKKEYSVKVTGLIRLRSASKSERQRTSHYDNKLERMA